MWIIADFPEDMQLERADYRRAMRSLGEFQMRSEDRAPWMYLVDVLKYTQGTWEECAAVFDYGRKKYAEWNWLRGMPWSAVIGPTARHLRKLTQGEELDAESGLPHRGHVMCNVVMLLQYLRTYPEGDNRPVIPTKEA